MSLNEIRMWKWTKCATIQTTADGGIIAPLRKTIPNFEKLPNILDPLFAVCGVTFVELPTPGELLC